MNPRPKRNRKGPRRKPRTEIDSDIAQLLSVLEDELPPPTVAAWLSIPWRDGWNAAALALHIARATPEFDRVKDTWEKLELLHTQGRRTSETYNILDGILHTIRWSHATPALRVAARCMQIVIAKSDGGGQVENALLEQIVTDANELVVRIARMCDALGLRIDEPSNQEIERRKAAFKTAWSRGLYRVAYAIPPIR